MQCRRWAQLEAEEKEFTEEESQYFDGNANFAYQSFRNKVLTVLSQSLLSLSPLSESLRSAGLRAYYCPKAHPKHKCEVAPPSLWRESADSSLPGRAGCRPPTPAKES